jgi:hypothetical protein
MKFRIFSTLLFLASQTLAFAGVIYNVSLDTAPLADHPAGPFSIAFQLADGSFTGDGNNAAILLNFDFGVGGFAVGSPNLVGSASGSLSTGVTLTDASPVNFFSQTFNPGGKLSFELFLTTNLDEGALPDQFIVYILDSAGYPIPTSAGEFFDAFVAVSIDSENPVPQTFWGDAGRAPVAGGSPIDTGPAVASSSVPEPGTCGTVGAMFLLLLTARRSRLKK